MLDAKNICKKFSAPVLEGVSLNVGEGEIIGIAGENGSGKSTLLSILAGLMEPDSGEVMQNGKLGYVPQEDALFDKLSVRDNMLFWSAAYKVKKASLEPLIADILMKKKVRHLSGGMKKRLSIALACLHGPEVLIMDEPSAGLDIGFKAVLSEMLRNMRAEGKSAVFTSHQPDELLWCDRVLILRGGKFVYEGSAKELNDLADILYGST